MPRSARGANESGLVPGLRRRAGRAEEFAQFGKAGRARRGGSSRHRVAPAARYGRNHHAAVVPDYSYRKASAGSTFASDYLGVYVKPNRLGELGLALVKGPELVGF